ncbi:hypothetical protein [Chlorogloeopsis sp. ULAP02]|uniref:hypothetical protein n=1 Tax=Chlorogloeopsis sp. ULAP02 TaxID=3107926 RepID=UPI00398B3703
MSDVHAKLQCNNPQLSVPESGVLGEWETRRRGDAKTRGHKESNKNQQMYKRQRVAEPVRWGRRVKRVGCDCRAGLEDKLSFEQQS